MSQLHGLTPDDLKKLKELMALVRSGRLVPPTRTSQDASFEESMGHQAPEVYIAKPTDTTTVNARAGNVVQPVLCDIYSIYKSNDEWRLYRVGVQREVFNVTTSELSDFIVVMRTKQGKWVPASGGGGGAELIIFIIREADCELGTARGEVFRIMCTGATVSIGDMIDLEDPMGCFLTGPSDSLIGTKGAAVKMLSDAGSYDNCEWVITALCCVFTTCPE